MPSATVEQPSLSLDDPAIRGMLRRRLQTEHRGEDDTVIVEELGLCRSAVYVDVTVVNGALHGYEIKSDRDSLRRLARQSEIYGRVLDRVTLVCGEKHLDQARELIPEWWEILAVDPTSGRLPTVRIGRVNPGRCARDLAELIWKPDAIRLLERRGVARVARLRRDQLWDRLVYVYTLDELAAEVRALLKARSVRPAAPPPR